MALCSRRSCRCPVDEVAREYPYRGIFGEVEARNPLSCISAHRSGTAGLKIFMALLFGFLFVKRFGGSEAAACFAACAYAFSVGLYYSSGTVMAMLPAALYALLYPRQGRFCC